MFSYRPEQPSQIESVYLPDLAAADLQDVAYDLTAAVNQPPTHSLLQERHLPGVIRRHVDLDTSYATVQRVAQKSEDEDAFNAFALMKRRDNAQRNMWVGMSTIMLLDLRRPTSGLAGLLPASMTRKTSLLSEQVPTRGRNVTAWINAGHSTIGELATAYTHLLSQGGEGLWTIEPGHPNETDAAQAIVMSGMKYNAPPLRYDDYESGETPPLSTLYQYHQ